jgi:hypothetical protein
MSWQAYLPRKCWRWSTTRWSSTARSGYAPRACIARREQGHSCAPEYLFPATADELHLRVDPADAIYRRPGDTALGPRGDAGFSEIW